ncbi:branched-chain amino acid ABC transporter substrate-binding protein [Motiliproteus sediminis]|uniref:branched-chain amino acid ABC transporter substrate-binding protein n=1 Tax=Motiliproteus sediminis TaxID=1468178 RepID=UPI001AEFAEFC|nr:branched-chain amino acid ABC transporter substrate-binding protein [Motiliproteus sediminis]
MTLFKKSVAVMALSAAMGTTAQADTIPVAIAGPMTGSVSQYGDMWFQGAHAAIELINKAGGVDGNTFEINEYDDACDPKQAVAVANKVVSDGIQFVFGHLCSSSTQPATDVYEDEGVIAVTTSTNPAITERGYQLIFRTIGLDSDQGPTAGELIANKIKPQRVAIIHDKQQYGEGIATSVHNYLKDAGVNVVMFEGITAGDKDFSSLITKMKRENIDLVYYGGYHPEAGLIMRQSHDTGYTPQFVGPEALGNKEISNIAGEAVEGLLVTLPSRYDLLPQNKAIVDLMKSKGQDPTGPFVWTAVAGVQAFAKAMDATDSTDPYKVGDYLRGNSVDTAMGKLTWDQKGDLVGFKFGIFTWHADGSGTPL